MRRAEKNKRKQKSSTLPLGMGVELDGVAAARRTGIYACCCMNKHMAIQSVNHIVTRLIV